MKLITRDTDYAIRALCCIASQEDKLISAAELIKRFKMPKPFLRKILQTLNRKNLLHSYKGKGGGFKLAKPPDKIYLLDLISIFQSPLRLNECTFKKKICPNVTGCALKGKLDNIEKYVVSQLKAVTIASLLK